MSRGTLSQITDRPSHDAALSYATSPNGTANLVITYVTSASNPACAWTTSEIQGLAETYRSTPDDTTSKPTATATANDTTSKSKRGEVLFYQMEITPTTQPLIKFGIQNTPICICVKGGNYCKTILVGDVAVLKEEIGEFMR